MFLEGNRSRADSRWQTSVERRVLILAPTANDGRLTLRFLEEAGIVGEVVPGIAQLCERVTEGCGAILLAEETLAADAIQILVAALAGQPSWSDIPVVIITSGGEAGQARLRRLATFGPGANVSLLERPFRPGTLLSAIEAALRARARQFQVRDLLTDVRAGKDRLQAILGSIDDAFVALDENWHFTYLNEAFLELVSPLYSNAGDLLGHGLWEKFPDLIDTEAERFFRSAMATRKPASLEFFYERVQAWLDVRVYPSAEMFSISLRDITIRKRQEETLAALARKLEEQTQVFDTTLSNITDFAYIFDREGRFIYANKPLLDLWGLTLEQAKGRSFFALHYPPDLAARLQREIDDVVEFGKVVRGETGYTSAAGDEGYYEYIFSPVFSADGRVDVIAGSTRVITERKRNEAIGEHRRGVLQLISEDASLEHVLEALMRLVELEVGARSKSSILLCDDSQLLRVGAAPSLPGPLCDALDGIEVGPFAASCGAAAWSAKPVYAEDIANDPLWVDFKELALSHGLRACWSTPVLSSQGRVLGTLALYFPEVRAAKREEVRILSAAASTAAVAIERKRAEAALRAREAQLRLVTDHASVFLAHCDREHRYKFVNRAYAARFGLQPAELIGLKVADVAGGAAYEIVREHFDTALRGDSVEFEAEIPFEKLGLRWMHTIYVPEHGRSGEVVGLVAVITDVTARKQSELELVRARDEALAASRAKDDFLAALSHELRTPLNPVLLISSEAATDPDLPEDIRRDFDTIAKSATLEARLIDDLLDLTRIGHGKMSLDMRTTDVHAVIADAIETVRSDVHQKRLKLEVRLSATEHHVVGDAARLQQVFWNVLKNAVKFTPISGVLTVESLTHPETRRCAIRITDTGIGMSGDEVGRIFDAFSQGNHADGSGSHRFGGLGLGLAISRMLVKLHAGSISAESAGKDLGSTFTIELPTVDVKADPPPAASASMPEMPPAKRGLKRILVVEDHVPTRVSLTRLLSRRGYKTVEAGSVSEALMRASQNKVDFVMSDIGLPDGDGYALMAELRARYRLCGIALSGYGMEQDISRGKIAGFAEHLIKPVSVQALDKALASAEVLSGR